MTISIQALAENHIPTVVAACSDWEHLAQFGPPYWRPRSGAELQRKIATTAGPQPSTDYNFVIVDAAASIIGECSVHAIDWRNGVAQVGVCIWRPDDRQHGYGSTAVQHMMDWGFGYLGLSRIEAWIVEDNEPSLKLFRRLGFTHEGTLRGRYLHAGIRKDMLVWALMAPPS